VNRPGQPSNAALPHFLGFLLRLAVRDDIIGVSLKSYVDPHVRGVPMGRYPPENVLEPIV
jgi:hypothetical protein